jgi:hypothetical protein
MRKQGKSHIRSGINTYYLLINLRRRLRVMTIPLKSAFPGLAISHFILVSEALPFCNI